VGVLEVTGKAAQIAHFRGKWFVLGGLGFFATGVIGLTWVRIFQYRGKGHAWYWVVVDLVDKSTGEYRRIGNIKEVYPEEVLADLGRVIGKIRIRKATLSTERE
jgi:hypothetical protein